MKLTRRQIVAAAAGASIAGKALAQTSPAATPDTGKPAPDAVQRNADRLSKFEIPLSTEPAFQFKA